MLTPFVSGGAPAIGPFTTARSITRLQTAQESHRQLLWMANSSRPWQALRRQCNDRKGRGTHIVDVVGTGSPFGPTTEVIATATVAPLRCNTRIDRSASVYKLLHLGRQSNAHPCVIVLVWAFTNAERNSGIERTQKRMDEVKDRGCVREAGRPLSP